jgi:hypothetical protein
MADTLQDQIRYSIESGGTEKVKNMTMTTGVRDSVTLQIINSLLELGKKLRKNIAGQRISESDVQQRLRQQLEELLAGRTIDNAINPLLDMPGIFLCQLFILFMLNILQV